MFLNYVNQEEEKELGRHDKVKVKEKTVVMKRRGCGGSGGGTEEKWTKDRYT